MREILSGIKLIFFLKRESVFSLEKPAKLGMTLWREMVPGNAIMLIASYIRRNPPIADNESLL